MKRVAGQRRSTVHAAANVFSSFQKHCLTTRRILQYFQQIRCFWDRHNAVWPFRCEPSSGRSLLTIAVCNVKELRYQFSSVYLYFISKSVNYRRNIPVGGIQDTVSCKSLLVLLYTLASADRFVTGYGWIVVFVDCGCKPAK